MAQIFSLKAPKCQTSPLMTSLKAREAGNNDTQKEIKESRGSERRILTGQVKLTVQLKWSTGPPAAIFHCECIRDECMYERVRVIFLTFIFLSVQHIVNRKPTNDFNSIRCWLGVNFNFLFFFTSFFFIQ